jgi:hypothetical protein
MIIWINGPFGIGKSHTAYELVGRIENSFLYNPEKVGFVLQKQLPIWKSVNDFQDSKAWRSYNYEHLHEIDASDQVIIVPMTVIKKEYYDEIIGKLKMDHTVFHFSLMASKATIEKRLTKRGDRRSWNFRQIDRCAEGLKDPLFEEKIDTETHDLYDVVEYIGKRVGLELKEDKRSKLKKKIDRGIITLKNINILS